MLDIQELLNALDGTAYVVDRNGTINAVGQPGWESFANETDASIKNSNEILGKSLFEMLRGEAVRQTNRKLHESVWLQHRRLTTFEYRCDSPTVERHMRMSISQIKHNDETISVLYQSQILSESSRVPMMIFSEKNWLTNDTNYDAAKVLTLCSYCHDVAWPIGAKDEVKNWISPEEYYRKYSHNEALISHGVCPACFERIIIENGLN